MRAGRLSHRVRIERATISQNEYGEPDQTWAELATVWAAVEPLKGSEQFAAMQVQSGADVRMVTRWSSLTGTATTADRIIFGSVVYDIKSVININSKNVQLDFMVRQHT